MNEFALENDYLFVCINPFPKGIIYWVSIGNYKDSIPKHILKNAIKQIKSYLKSNPSKIYGAAYVSLEKRDMFDKIIAKLGYKSKHLYIQNVPITIFSTELNISELELGWELDYLFGY